MTSRHCLLAVLLGISLTALSATAQAPHAATDPASAIGAKRMEIRHHTERMQAITDSAELQRETQKHFAMVEELMGLMLAEQRQALGGASGASSMPMEGEMAMPAPGGQPGMMDDDAMEMPMGGASGGGMGGSMPSGQGGMMDDAMEMPPPSSAGGGMSGGMMGGMHGEHGMGMGGAAGGQGMPGAPDAAKRIAEREALLAEVTRHSQYIETLKDPDARTREILRHQQMLDRLLELMR